MEDEKLSPEGVEVEVEEFAIDGPVYESNGLRVIAFEVDHGDAIKPAYGYRIEYDGRVVTVSGDTRYNENVVRFGAGVDLLIHEVAIARPELMSQPHIQRIMAASHDCVRSWYGILQDSAEACGLHASCVSGELKRAGC
jgi:ribonuclease Z